MKFAEVSIQTQVCKCLLRRPVYGAGEGRRGKVTAISSVSAILGGEYHQSKKIGKWEEGRRRRKWEKVAGPLFGMVRHSVWGGEEKKNNSHKQCVRNPRGEYQSKENGEMEVSHPCWGMGGEKGNGRGWPL